MMWMTEKQYTHRDLHLMSMTEMLDLLNGLFEENEQLKSKLFDTELELEHSKESNDDAYYELTQVKKENERLKTELKGMEELLKSYRKTIEHDAKLLADATKNDYLPPLEDWKR